MPGFDGTGPRGQGPRTGGGFGRCRVDFNVGDRLDAPRGAGRGYLPWGGGCGRAWGGGRGPGRGQINARLPREDDLAMLRDQAAQLARELQAVNERLHQFENGRSAPAGETDKS